VLVSMTLVAAACQAAGAELAAKPAETPEIRIRSFLPEQPLARAQRPASLAALVENTGPAAVDVRTRLVLPAGVKISGPHPATAVRIDARATWRIVCQIEADQAAQHELRLEVDGPGGAAATAPLTMLFLPPVEARKLPYLPEPQPVATTGMNGAKDTTSHPIASMGSATSTPCARSSPRQRSPTWISFLKISASGPTTRTPANSATKRRPVRPRCPTGYGRRSLSPGRWRAMH
jgi:hypothetical protein